MCRAFGFRSALTTLLSGLVLPALLLATLLLATLAGLVLATLLTTLVLLLAALLLVLVILVWIAHGHFPSLLISIVKINRRKSLFVPCVI
jgi:hypothetical protein